MTDKKPTASTESTPAPKLDSRFLPLAALRAHSHEWLAKRCEMLQNSILKLEANNV